MLPIRRSDQVSEGLQNVISKSIEQYKQIKEQMRQANELANPNESPSPVANPNEMPLSDAIASGRFTYAQFDLYKEADTDTEFGRIWVKKEVIDPKTGKKQDWLVVYTSDEDELIRQIANEGLREARAMLSDIGDKVKFIDNQNIEK